MQKKQQHQMDFLLSRGGLSSARHEEIFAQVAHATAAERNPSRTKGLWIAILSLALGAAATVAFWIVPNDRPTERFALQARGGDHTAVNVYCLHGQLSACPVGATLGFLVEGNSSEGYLTAYADPIDPPGERIWYFSTDAGALRVARAGDNGAVAPRGIRLGPEHGLGRYRVVVLFSPRPLSQAQIRAGVPMVGVVRAEFPLAVSHQ